MSSPPPGQPSAPPGRFTRRLSRPDQHILKELRRREREEEARARALARELDEGSPCPVCLPALPPVGQPPAEGGPRLDALPSLIPAALVRLSPLACEACEFHVPVALSSAGWTVVMAFDLAAALGGTSAVFGALRLDPGPARLITFLAGGVLFLAAILLAGRVQGARSSAQLGHRIVRRRRRQSEGAVNEPGGLADSLEAVVVAVILALVVRHFAMEAFVIPTGSMAPTLLGDHFPLHCTNCDYPFALGKDEDDFNAVYTEIQVTARCPVCRTELRRTLHPSDVQGGDKILVNKFSYLLRAPRRFELLVFKFPREPWKNFIKRLIGLPGETIELRNGDLFVDGRKERKPDEVQEAIWIPVLDGRYQRRSPLELGPTWQAEREPERWELSDERRLVCRPEAGRPGPWLSLRRIDPEAGEGAPDPGIRDGYAYSRERWGQQGDTPVADLRVRARVTASQAGRVRLAVVEDERVVAASFPVGGGECALEVDGVEQARGACPPLQPGAPHELELAYWDDQAVLRVDGVEALRWEDAQAPAQTLAYAGVRLQAEGAGEVVFEGVRIDRDVIWVPALGGDPTLDPAEQPVKIPPGKYFVLGDNSPHSEDGRKWGFVDQGHVVGRAFFVFWPLLPSRVGVIR